MIIEQILNSFLENYTILSPGSAELEIDTMRKLSDQVSIPEILVFMEARRIIGDVDYYSLHVWKEIAEDFLRGLTETNYLISECSDYSPSGEEVRPSVMLAGEIETGIGAGKSVTIFWPKNTYNLAEFTRDLDVLDYLDSFNGRYPVTIQGESDLPNMIMFGGHPLTEYEIQTGFPGLLDRYNMVTYYQYHFYVHLVKDLSEIYDAIKSDSNPDHINIGRLNVLTQQGLTSINTQHLPPSGPLDLTSLFSQHTKASTVESFADNTTTNNVNSILGYAIISCIMLVSIWTGIGAEVPVEVLFA